MIVGSSVNISWRASLVVFDGWMRACVVEMSWYWLSSSWWYGSTFICHYVQKIITSLGLFRTIVWRDSTCYSANVGGWLWDHFVSWTDAWLLTRWWSWYLLLSQEAFDFWVARSLFLALMLVWTSLLDLNQFTRQTDQYLLPSILHSLLRNCCLHSSSLFRDPSLSCVPMNTKPQSMLNSLFRILHTLLCYLNWTLFETFT